MSCFNHLVIIKEYQFNLKIKRYSLNFNNQLENWFKCKVQDKKLFNCGFTYTCRHKFEIDVNLNKNIINYMIEILKIELKIRSKKRLKKESKKYKKQEANYITFIEHDGNIMFGILS